MLEGTTRFKPDALLGVFIGKEEAILCRRAQPLDLGQLLSEGSRCVHHRRLGEEKIYDDASFWSMADKVVIVRFFGNSLAHQSINFDKSNIQMNFR